MKAATHDPRRAAKVSFAEVVDLRGQAAGIEADAARTDAKRKSAGTVRTSKRKSRLARLPSTTRRDQRALKGNGAQERRSAEPAERLLTKSFGEHLPDRR